MRRVQAIRPQRQNVPSGETMKAQVWSLCDRTQTALAPWRDAGYSVCSIDTHPASGGMPGITARVQDIEFLDGAVFVMAWPPCTHLAASGARWWKEKGDEALREALSNVDACRRLIGTTAGIVENPKGRLSTYWRKPDAIVHPWQFSGFAAGESYSKETCLWLLNGAVRPIESYSDEPVDTTRIHHMSPYERASDAGIKTPAGLSIGIFKANEPLVRR